MKCASVDENTKLRARIQFLSCKMTFEETAINFLTRLEQKANEARNYDIRKKISLGTPQQYETSQIL